MRAPHDFGVSQYHLSVIFVRECKDGRLSCQKGLGLGFIRIGPGEAKLLESRSDMPYPTFGAAQSVSGGGVETPSEPLARHAKLGISMGHPVRTRSRAVLSLALVTAVFCIRQSKHWSRRRHGAEPSGV